MVRKWGGWILGVGVWILPLVWIDFTTYLTLTIAGVTMGMLLFLTASGLTVIFGLMDVLNLTHGAFFAWGAYAGFSLLNYLTRLGWVERAAMGQSLGDLALVLLLALVVGAVLGLILEWILIRRTYGNHLKQILITMGGALVMAEIIRIVWGPNDEAVTVPAAFRGSWDLYDVLVNKFRGVAILVGLIIFGPSRWCSVRPSWASLSGPGWKTRKSSRSWATTSSGSSPGCSRPERPWRPWAG